MSDVYSVPAGLSEIQREATFSRAIAGDPTDVGWLRHALRVSHARGSQKKKKERNAVKTAV